MDDAQIFDAIADERRTLADVLDGLDDSQWATQSLCGAWDVRGVAAHLLGPTVTGIPEILWLVLRARGGLREVEHGADRPGGRETRWSAARDAARQR
ncbi:MAG: maleylpyruvate isomerase N-terminal domain-containing protein [Gordonia paraffinivorans]